MKLVIEKVIEGPKLSVPSSTFFLSDITHLHRSGRDVSLLATALYVLVLFNLVSIRNCHRSVYNSFGELRQTSLRKANERAIFHMLILNDKKTYLVPSELLS